MNCSNFIIEHDLQVCIFELYEMLNYICDAEAIAHITDKSLLNNGLVYHNIMLEQYIMHDALR